MTPPAKLTNGHTKKPKKVTEATTLKKPKKPVKPKLTENLPGLSTSMIEPPVASLSLPAVDTIVMNKSLPPVSVPINCDVCELQGTKDDTVK